MPRCALPAIQALSVLSILACLTHAADSHAQVTRNFPATALRGHLVVTAPPEALLNGRPARLAPGVRLRGPDNLLLMSGAVSGQKLLVHYTLDLYGLVHEVWVLNPAEAARRPWPATPQESATWAFNFDTQTWARP